MDAGNRDEVMMALLESALALPQAARAAYVRSQASSPEMSEEILERADWEERMAGFLEVPLIELGDADEQQSVPAGRRMGHYLIQQELGRGGMGVVYRAVDQNLGRTVALKVLSQDAGSEIDRKRFLREAKAASALSHPNIITIHEFDSDSGQDFIAMEYIEGKTLDQAISPATPLAERRDYARQTAVALAKAHAAGIVHRDLKPGNIMVTRQGQIKVLDFGLAKQQHKVVGQAEETQTTDAITVHGALLGTPAYMSPEQVSGEEVDHRSDIFSFCVMLYQMICGQRPFQGTNPAALLVNIASKPHRPVREVNPSAPPRLAALIDRCLAKKREDRLASLDTAASELASVQAALGEVRPVRRLLPWIAGVVLAIALGGGWWWQHRVPVLRYALVTEKGEADPRAMTFRGGSQFRLRLQASKRGFAYVVNEGPGEQGRTRFYVLMPRPGASAAVEADEKRLTGWLVFDQNPGVERMWAVWSEEPIRVLEEAVNGPAKGLVEDAGRGAEIAAFLGRLRTSGQTTGSLVELRHQ
jgi:Kae1-associated kinase Bud32